VSVRKVRFLKKVDADLARNSHQRWPDVAKLSSLTGNNAAPHILLETLPTRPGEAIQAESPLQGGDSRLDAGTEVPPHLVNPGALGHLHHGQPSLLGKDGILDFPSFGKCEVIPRSKTSVGAYLARRPAELLFVPFDQLPVTIAVSRVAPLNQAVQNQIGGAAGQEDLVAVLNIPTPLDDDIGMILEKGNDTT